MTSIISSDAVITIYDDRHAISFGHESKAFASNALAHKTSFIAFQMRPDEVKNIVIVFDKLQLTDVEIVR